MRGPLEIEREIAALPHLTRPDAAYDIRIVEILAAWANEIESEIRSEIATKRAEKLLHVRTEE